MTSMEYRRICKVIAIKLIRVHFPGLKPKVTDKLANEIAVNIHARLYGANVDGVDSPIFRDDKGSDYVQPTISAEDLLKC